MVRVRGRQMPTQDYLSLPYTTAALYDLQIQVLLQ